MTSQRDNYKDLTKTISVDSQNRITQVQDALSTTIGNYWYDEGGFRVRKKALVPSGAGFKNQEILYPSKFYGLEYAEDTNVLSSINNVYLNGVRIAALNEEGTAAYFLTDQVDSVAHVLDEGAHTLSRMQYEPYGETLVQRGTLDFAPKYNSQELDRETNFYFYNARYYDPQIARFTSADSVVDGAGNTQGWNRFSYVAGNPIGAKDPTGHWSTKSISGVSQPVHQMAVKRVLGKFVSKLDLNTLKAAQIEIDEYQKPDEQHMHAMTDGKAVDKNGRPISRKTQIKNANQFMKRMLKEAIVGRKEDRFQNLLKLGFVIHDAQDATSPSHRGAQDWDKQNKVDHVKQERWYPSVGSKEALELEGATMWIYEIYSGRAKMPENFLNPSTGLLNLPKEYGGN